MTEEPSSVELIQGRAKEELLYVPKELTKFMGSSLGAPATSGTSTIVFNSCLHSKNILERLI